MKKVFNLTIDAAHPVVAHHLVQEQAILPGLAYIDLLMMIARQGMQLDCFQSELRDLVIHQPLIVAKNGQVRLTISASELSRGSYAIEVARDSEPNVVYCTAELHPARAGIEPDLDVTALETGWQSRLNLMALYERARARGLAHDGLMRADGTVSCFDWGCLIDLCVSESHRHLLDAAFHPTLLDGSAIASSVLETALAPPGEQAQGAAEGLYLPLHYGAFRARAPLGAACLARVRLDSIKTSHDIRKLDIDFYEKNGRWLASLVELTGKRVRNGVELQPRQPKTGAELELQQPKIGVESQLRQSKPSSDGAGDTFKLEQELRGVFAEHLDLAPHQVDMRRGFFDMGLSSAQLLTLLKDIERLLSQRLNPTLLFEYNTIAELVAHFHSVEAAVPSTMSTQVPSATSNGEAPAQEGPRYRFAASEPYLTDHLVDGKPALMGLTYPCLVLQACADAGQGHPLSLQDIRFHGGPLKLEPGETVTVEIQLEPNTDAPPRFVARQRCGDRSDWTLCCEGQTPSPDENAPPMLDRQRLLAGARELSRSEIDEWFCTVPAFTLGPTLRSIERAFALSDGTLVSEVNLSGKTSKQHVPGLMLDPLLLNNCYLFNLARDIEQEAPAPTFLPFVIERLTLWQPMTERAVVVTRPRQVNAGFIALDAAIYSETGHCIASVTNASLRQLVKVEETAARAVPERSRAGHRDAIAIVGIAGRFPQAYDLDAFWDNLQAGKDCITEIPPERWDWRDYYSAGGEPGTISSKWGGFIDDADTFDPLFFQISPREAEVMDPLERLFLQHCWMAMEDGGYTRDTLRASSGSSRVGVYAGVMGQEYPLFALEATERLGLGGGTSSVASRLAYLCNFNGPTMAIDTMCSSALVAIDMARQALVTGAIDAAFAGGVNLSLHPSKYLMLSRGQFISSKGHCESFGDGSGGYIPSEGVGVLMLRCLADAERDGDVIYGVIRSSAVNHGGRASGYTVPNPMAQAEVIRRAIEQAGIRPMDISYIEAHGTGTRLGDPIEISGLTKAFGADATRAMAASCRIGSVKSNIGHCEGAAGVAGVLKVLLQMRHGMIVPSLHSQRLNPAIDFSATPFTVNQELVPWLDEEADGRPRRRIAGVSSFGAGGVNAHAIIESYSMPPAEPYPTEGAQWLILLSAREPARLPLMAAKLLAAIERQQLDERALPSLAYTLQIGREAMEHRAAVIVGSMRELQDKLRAFGHDGSGNKDWYRGSASQNLGTVQLYKDEDAGVLLQTWLEKTNLHALAQVWVMGVTPDWQQLYQPETGFARPPRRMSLPSYPFKTDRYWIADAARIAPAPAHGTHPPAPTHAAHLFTKAWRLSTSSDSVHALPRAADRGFILLLTTAATRALAERLAALRPGARIVHADDLADQIEQICQPKDYPLAYVLDLTALDDEYAVRSVADVECWLPGVQRLIEQVRLNGVRLLCVTRHLELFLRPASLAPAPHAAIKACLYRSLGYEYQRLQSGHMDTDLPDDAPDLPRQILAQLEREVLDPQVCLRAGQAYLPYLAPLSAAADERPFDFPPAHVLWITGGTRGLGLLCAQHFVTRYGVRKLVLSGREPLPPAARWSEILADPNGTRVKPGVRDKIAELVKLQQRGVYVHVVDVDLTDARAIEAACETIRRELGPIGGVIHCAGVGDTDPALIRKSVSNVNTVFAPKTAGLDSLCRALRGQPLSLFVVYSSVCAALPSLAAGQIDYAMANAYMDAVAGHRPACRLLSLQWPSWLETGMGAMDTKIYRAIGLLGLKNQDGLALLDRALEIRGRPVVLPALVDLALWQRSVDEHADDELDADAGDGLNAHAGDQLNADAGDGLDVHASNKHEAKRTAAPELKHEVVTERTQAWLSSLFMAELKIAAADFDAQVDFPNYGLDSILMAQILRTINVQLGVDLAPSLILEHPNLVALTMWLVTHEGAALVRFFAADEVDAETVRPQDKTAAPRLPMSARGGQAVSMPELAARCPSTALDNAPRQAQDNIVVVGMSARFPGAPNLAEYWRLLKDGRSAFSNLRTSASRPRIAGTVDHQGHFDRATFHIPVEDFNAMDPQALMVLEECLNLWAHAGYRPEDIKGSATGVFLGGRGRAALDPSALRSTRNPIVVAGQNYLAANVSHFFDISGPSLVIDTACSSALVGMSMAAQALRGGEISAAIVGGVSLLGGDQEQAIFEQRGLLSAGPEFHLFDERANGIILAEGVGLVLLKTEEQARRDGDTIYARITALACNNDGRTAGPATPNLERQTDLMLKVLAQAGLDARQIGYIETNGSGSKITDLLELKAIDAVYGRGANFSGAASRESCALGSIKPNIGHPLCAEGIASFIKAVLMLHHASLVPFLSGQQPLRHFDLAASPFYFPRAASALPMSQDLAIAINCFADGGNNAHLILQRARATDKLETGQRQPLAPPVLHRQTQAASVPDGAQSDPAVVDDGRLPAIHDTAMIWEQF